MEGRRLMNMGTLLMVSEFDGRECVGTMWSRVWSERITIAKNAIALPPMQSPQACARDAALLQLVEHELWKMVQKGAVAA